MLSDWSNVDSTLIRSNRYITSYRCYGYYKESLITQTLMIKLKKSLLVRHSYALNVIAINCVVTRYLSI